MAKHSKGPWRIDKQGAFIINIKGIEGDICGVWTVSGNDLANAERIVACVNAMEGVAHPETFLADRQKEWLERHENVIVELETLRKQMQQNAVLGQCEQDTSYNRIVTLEAALKKITHLESNEIQGTQECLAEARRIANVALLTTEGGLK